MPEGRYSNIDASCSRLVESIVDRFEAGESVSDLAYDFLTEEYWINRILAAFDLGREEGVDRKEVLRMTVRIDLAEEPIYLQTPNGDQYSVRWDRGAVELNLEKGSQNQFPNAALAVIPMSPRTVLISLRRRKK
jgi:hypothetical protein